MPKLPDVSGREAVRAFSTVGYEAVRQRGSHIRLRHPSGERIPLTIPDQPSLKHGLLRALIRDAGMTVEDFIDALK